MKCVRGIPAFLRIDLQVDLNRKDINYVFQNFNDFVGSVQVTIDMASGCLAQIENHNDCNGKNIGKT